MRSGPVAIPEPKDLLETLARFNYHYSRLSAIFNRLWYIPFEDLTPDQNPKAYAAIDAFSKLVDWIATHWPKPEIKTRSPKQQAGVLSAASLASADQDEPLQTLVTSIPVVMIPEYPLANDSKQIFAAGESEVLIKGLATLLADTLNSWEKKKNPAREGGSYRFAVSFYARGDTSQTQALLVLTQLWLDLDCIESPNS